jgi:hypothetical protein
MKLRVENIHSCSTPPITPKIAFNKLEVFKQHVPKSLTNGDTDPHMISKVALKRRLHNKWIIRFQVTTKKIKCWWSETSSNRPNHMKLHLPHDYIHIAQKFVVNFSNGIIKWNIACTQYYSFVLINRSFKGANNDTILFWGLKS